MKTPGKLLEDSVQPLSTLATSTAHGAAWWGPGWEIQRFIRWEQLGWFQRRLNRLLSQRRDADGDARPRVDHAQERRSS